LVKCTGGKSNSRKTQGVGKEASNTSKREKKIRDETTDGPRIPTIPSEGQGGFGVREGGLE